MPAAVPRCDASSSAPPIDTHKYLYIYTHTGMRTNESTPFWPKEMKAPEGAPNVLMILIDDAGFGATSAFGGPIPTPTFEKLAARGLRYTAFHTTALCSPTRAALLTGRNHHSVHTGTITETASGTCMRGMVGRAVQCGGRIDRPIRMGWASDDHECHAPPHPHTSHARLPRLRHADGEGHGLRRGDPEAARVEHALVRCVGGERTIRSFCLFGRGGGT